MILVSIHDLKARAYFKPFTSATEQTAVRELAVVAKQPDSPLFLYPDDYHAVVIGDFDPEAGTVKGRSHVILSIPREVK